MDLEQLTEVTQDSLQRLAYRVEDVVRVSDKMAQCRSQTRGGQENLAPTLTPGTYTVEAGEARLEIKCKSVAVRVRGTGS